MTLPKIYCVSSISVNKGVRHIALWHMFSMRLIGVYIALVFIYITKATIPFCHICTPPIAATARAPKDVDSQALAPIPSTDFPGTYTEGVFDVTMYGAVPDGKTDSSLEFLAAWTDACDYEGGSILYIPNGTFFVGPISFSGPCNHQSPNIDIRGNLKAPTSLNAFPTPTWIMFRSLIGMRLTGGTLDAQGEEAWMAANCCKNKGTKCPDLPRSVRFVDVSNVTISNIEIMNSKAFHMSFLNSDNIDVHDINLRAPGDSPNTDGIHISNSANISISSSIIGVGDDCVSIGPGCTNITISNITCGPGHGISIGSLGKYPKEKDVVGVSVRNCTIRDTKNGVRIKTWPKSPASSASNMTFEDIIMINVSNPIIIDQEYCPWHSCTSFEVMDSESHSVRRIACLSAYASNTQVMDSESHSGRRIACLSAYASNTQVTGTFRFGAVLIEEYNGWSLESIHLF